MINIPDILNHWNVRNLINFHIIFHFLIFWFQPYPAVQARNPKTFRTHTHVRVRGRNVNGFDFKLSTGTERRRVVSRN